VFVDSIVSPSEWHLEPDEKPIKLMQHFFKSMGYTDEDKLEQQGRKDHGYLFSFIYSDRPHNFDKRVSSPACPSPLITFSNEYILGFATLSSPLSETKSRSPWSVTTLKPFLFPFIDSLI